MSPRVLSEWTSTVPLTVESVSENETASSAPTVAMIAPSTVESVIVVVADVVYTSPSSVEWPTVIPTAPSGASIAYSPPASVR